MAASLLQPATAKAICESVSEILSRKEDSRHEAIYEALLASRHREHTEDVVTAAFRRSRSQRLSALASVPTPPTAASESAVLSAPEFKKNLRLLVNARSRRRRAAECLTLGDVQLTLKILMQQATQGNCGLLANPGLVRINYDMYCTVADTLPAKVKPLLTASTFLKLPRDEVDQLTITTLCRYLRARVVLMNSWRRVSAYESESDGIFRENDLENYVYEAIAELPDLTHLSEVFYPFYVFTAVRKIFFGLDPNRMGKIRSADLLTSKVFWEWLQLFPPWHADVGGCGSKELYPQKSRLDDEIKRSMDFSDRANDSVMDMLAASVICECDTEVTRTNWFSAANAVRVYSLYLDLDVDQNGLLSPSELTRAQNSTLTEAFVGRVFQEVHTYTGEMDYKAFLDFTLAMEFRTSSSSMRYIFSALDLHRRGYLTLFELKYFFGEVVQRVVAAGHEPVDVANVCDEIFDMVNPEAPGRITLNDLKRCKVGHTVLHLLTDAAGFWQYDNREALLQQQQQARDGGEAPSIPTDLSHLDER